MRSVALLALTIRPGQSVPAAFMSYSKKIPDGIIPRHLSKLIHRRNHHTWWLAVHLFIDDFHRYTQIWRIAFGKLASAQFVTTEDHGSSISSVVFAYLNISFFQDLASTPWATVDLAGRRTISSLSVPYCIDVVFRLLCLVWSNRSTHPQANGKRLLAPDILLISSNDFHCTD